MHGDPATEADALTLERAAQIIAERSTKPDAVATRAMVKVLNRQAAIIRREMGPHAGH